MIHHCLWIIIYKDLNNVIDYKIKPNLAQMMDNKG
jgi:hypothetical protein